MLCYQTVYGVDNYTKTIDHLKTFNHGGGYDSLDILHARTRARFRHTGRVSANVSYQTHSPGRPLPAWRWH